MITVLDFVNAGGRARTAAGYEFQLSYIAKDQPYPIVGYVINPAGVKSLHKWDINGNPENLPLTHGLNLIPVVPIITYHMIDVKKLNEFDKVQDLINSEIKRIR